MEVLVRKSLRRTQQLNRRVRCGLRKPFRRRGNLLGIIGLGSAWRDFIGKATEREAAYPD